MTSTLARIILSAFLFLLFLPQLTFAETKTFTKEYTYQASEDDSRNSCRTLALQEVKRLLLEELGTYLESVTEVQNFQLTKDRITALTAGIVQTEIMADKWDGDSLKYWLKAKIVTDSNEVIKSIDTLRNDRAKTKELEDVKRRSDELLRENQRLRKELSIVTAEQKPKEIAAYNKTIRDLAAIDWEERAYALALAHSEDAIRAFNESIELNPHNARVFYYRGLAYDNLGDSEQAIKDYSKAIELDPKDAEPYGDRGRTYANLGNYRQAINDYNKIIELNSLYKEIAYRFRGIAYSKLGNFNQAIKDYSKAIEIDSKYVDAYGSRGIAYANLGNYWQAIKDYSKVIESDAKYSIFYDGNAFGNAFYYRGIAYGKLGNHKHEIDDLTKAMESGGLISDAHLFATAYNLRGIAYGKLGNHQRALEDFKDAAKLGLIEAQDYLRSQGIKW